MIKVLTKLWTIPPENDISNCQLCNIQFTDLYKHVACSCSYFSSIRDQFWSDITNFDLGICAKLCALDEEEPYTYILGKTPTTPLSEQNEKELTILCGNYIIQVLANSRRIVHNHVQ